MSAEITLSSDLPTLTAEIHAYKRVAGEAIFEIGRRLKHVKENDLVHGEWSRWCIEDIGMTRQQADKFIVVFDELGAFDNPNCHIGVTRLYEISLLHPEERERSHTIPSTGATKTVEEMTVRELREVRAELKREQAAREQAEAEREKAQEDYELVRDTLESVREQPPRIETEYVRDAAAEDRLRQYEEKFGDIEIYKQARIGNVADISTSLQTFDYDARTLLKRYAFLQQYGADISRMHGSVLEDYRNTVGALANFVTTLSVGYTDSHINRDIINI
ncbi:DUF3102 domain-containing protein [Paenibacillus sp. FSL L8-0436]|uniref:DUF3102 domain-containing protein n=1 Tax=Paenibacillus sp. FSL L8-0436 TaxID=2954686 RepID=UPI003158935E